MTNKNQILHCILSSERIFSAQTKARPFHAEVLLYVPCCRMDTKLSSIFCKFFCKSSVTFSSFLFSLFAFSLLFFSYIAHRDTLQNIFYRINSLIASHTHDPYTTGPSVDWILSRWTECNYSTIYIFFDVSVYFHHPDLKHYFI